MAACGGGVDERILDYPVGCYCCNSSLDENILVRGAKEEFHTIVFKLEISESEQKKTVLQPYTMTIMIPGKTLY